MLTDRYYYQYQRKRPFEPIFRPIDKILWFHRCWLPLTPRRRLGSKYRTNTFARGESCHRQHPYSASSLVLCCSEDRQRVSLLSLSTSSSVCPESSWIIQSWGFRFLAHFFGINSYFNTIDCACFVLTTVHLLQIIDCDCALEEEWGHKMSRVNRRHLLCSDAALPLTFVDGLLSSLDQPVLRSY